MVRHVLKTRVRVSLILGKEGVFSQCLFELRALGSEPVAGQQLASLWALPSL